MIQLNLRMVALTLVLVSAATAAAQPKSVTSSLAARQAYASAAAFQNEGVLELAAEDWEAFLQRFAADPLAAEAQYHLAACYFKLGKFDRAADAFGAVATKYPNFDRAETSLLNLGIATYQAATATSGDKSRFNQAAAALGKFLQRYPQSKDAPAALAMRAQAFLAAGKQPEAVSSWLELIDKYPHAPQHAETLYAAGMSLLERKQPAEASKLFDRLEREHGESSLVAVARFELGEYEYHQQKDYAAAARAYAAARAKTTDAKLAEKIDFKLGWSYYQQQDFSRAEQAFVAMLRQNGGGRFAADAQLMLGECLFKQGKFDAALPRLTTALAGKISSSDLTALDLLRAGESAAKVKRWADSLKFLDRLIGEYADSPYCDEALLQRAEALKNLGQADEALRQYEKLAANVASPVAMPAQFMVGQIDAERNNHRDAVRAFYKIIRAPEQGQFATAPSWKALATYQAARSFESLQNFDQAKRLYQELVEKYPHSERAPTAKERLTALERQH